MFQYCFLCQGHTADSNCQQVTFPLPEHGPVWSASNKTACKNKSFVFSMVDSEHIFGTEELFCTLFQLVCWFSHGSTTPCGIFPVRRECSDSLNTVQFIKPEALIISIYYLFYEIVLCIIVVAYFCGVSFIHFSHSSLVALQSWTVTLKGYMYPNSWSIHGKTNTELEAWFESVQVGLIWWNELTPVSGETVEQWSQIKLEVKPVRKTRTCRIIWWGKKRLFPAPNNL